MDRVVITTIDEKPFYKKNAYWVYLTLLVVSGFVQSEIFDIREFWHWVLTPAMIICGFCLGIIFRNEDLNDTP